LAYWKLIPTKNRIHLSDEVVTMAEALRAGGYHTIHLGKYHIGEDPLQDGFEVNIGGDYTGGPQGGGYFSPWKDGSIKACSDTPLHEAYRDEPMFIHF
jgi:arylsulfatase A-like enzyme